VTTVSYGLRHDHFGQHPIPLEADKHSIGKRAIENAPARNVAINTLVSDPDYSACARRISKYDDLVRMQITPRPDVLATKKR